MNKRTKVAVASVLAASAALGTASAAVASEPARTDRVQTQVNSNTEIGADSNAQSPQLTWNVVSNLLQIAGSVAQGIVDHLETQDNREGWVRGILESAWYESDEKYNVLVIKDDHDYDANLEGIKFDATYDTEDYPKFRVVVFESGEITNNGDGGYINWAFRGDFERDDMTVTFNKKS